MNMDIGRGRWISRESFQNTTQAFDGLHWSVGNNEEWHVRAFLAEPVQIKRYPFDPVMPAHTNTVWGLYAETRQFQDFNMDSRTSGMPVPPTLATSIC